MNETKEEMMTLLSARQGIELEDEYPRNFQLALSVSLVGFILMFSLVKGVQVSPYRSTVGAITPIEQLPALQDVVEPPPPPVTPRVQVDVAAPGDQTVQDQDVDVNVDIDFSLDQGITPPAVDSVFEIYTVEQAPEITSFVHPAYPDMARNAGVEGRVVVQVVVDENGKVMPGSARILSTTNEIFNAPALDAAMACTFSPGKMGDRAVKVRVNIPFAFRIEH